ncbi:unnamed protein product [Microthlaspi erraticum]|uniref:Retrotransposon gag domain-containing protein n=1 Tax=Microthlaspi erraticum TaxID=1685480 RepID=A0A6D2KF94_9BRAS|nr:unnamed protein product [Microthlaspi erraticum]
MVSESENEEESSNSANNKVLIDAITAQMEKMMNTKLEALRNELTNQNQTPNGEAHAPERDNTKSKRRRKEPGDFGAEDYYSNHSNSSQRSQGRSRRSGEYKDLLQDNLGGLKIKIPPFHGRNDPDAYLDWEKKIELVFNCQHYVDVNRVKVAATEFYDYALSWWDQIVTSRRQNG